MAWYTDAEIKASLAAAIHTALAELPADWDQIVQDANRRAKGQLVDFFRQGAYSDAQIDIWADSTSTTDYGATYHKSQALYWCGVYGKAHLTEAAIPLLDKMNVMEELAGLTLTNGGLPVDPTTTEGVGAGLLTERQSFDDAIAQSRQGAPAADYGPW